MNVHSVSKLSAAVMTLAILSYCRQKSHDSAAAPAPASQPKTEAPDATAPASTAPASTAPACTAVASTAFFCQTQTSIDPWIDHQFTKAEAFCFHKVEHPALSLKDGQAISADMQLKQGLDVAFLNVVKDFDGAQASCTSLGAGWHAPLSNNQQATPRAADNSNSLEAVGKYFVGISGQWFWSSSTVPGNTNTAWNVYLPSGRAAPDTKDYSFLVVCVRP